MRRILCAGVVLAAALTLGACENEPESSPGPEPSMIPSDSAGSGATSEPTDEPSVPTEPTLPAAATKPTKAGAEAFVEYYWGLVSYAQSTGDVMQLERLGGPDCSGCDGGAAFISEIYRRDGTIVADPYRVTELTLHKYPTSSKTPVYNALVTTRSSRQVIHVPGKKTQRVPPISEKWDLTIIFTHEAWRVDQLSATS